MIYWRVQTPLSSSAKWKQQYSEHIAQYKSFGFHCDTETFFFFSFVLYIYPKYNSLIGIMCPQFN